MHRYPLLSVLALIYCLNVPVLAQTQAEMNEEVGRKLKAADDELNVVYKKLIAKLDDIGKDKLKASQREWIKFPDAESEFASDYYRGATLSALVYLQAKTALTEKRLAELKSHLSEYEAQH